MSVNAASAWAESTWNLLPVVGAGHLGIHCELAGGAPRVA